MTTEKTKQKRMKGIERHDQIMRVCAKGFEKYGYRGYSTREMSSDCGITEPILYRHFSGKKSLFIKIIEERIENDRCDMMIVQGMVSRFIDDDIKRIMVKAQRKFGKSKIADALIGK